MAYNASIVPQASDLHIGLLFKEGVTAQNPRLIDGSDLGDIERRKAFVVDVKIGRFDFLLIVVNVRQSGWFGRLRLP